MDWFLDGITLLLIKSLALVGFLYGDPLSLVVMEPSLLYDRRCVSMVSRGGCGFLGGGSLIIVKWSGLNGMR